MPECLSVYLLFTVLPHWSGPQRHTVPCPAPESAVSTPGSPPELSSSVLLDHLEGERGIMREGWKAGG